MEANCLWKLFLSATKIWSHPIGKIEIITHKVSYLLNMKPTTCFPFPSLLLPSVTNEPSSHSCTQVGGKCYPWFLLFFHYAQPTEQQIHSLSWMCPCAPSPRPYPKVGTLLSYLGQCGSILTSVYSPLQASNLSSTQKPQWSCQFLSCIMSQVCLKPSESILRSSENSNYFM